MVTLIGASGSNVNALEWAQTLSLQSERQVVADGALVPSVGAGTREAVISGGWVYVCGGLAKFVGATSVGLAANGGTVARQDQRVAEFNYGSSASALGTPANSVEIKTIQGAAGGGVPYLTQEPGVLWQVPLGLYTVPPGGGAVTVRDVRPRRRVAKVYKDVVNTTLVVASNTAGAERAAVNVPDPGWPYRLEVLGAVTFQGIASGRAVVIVNVDDAELTRGRTNVGADAPAVIRPEWTDVRNAAARVSLVIAPLNASEALAPVPTQSGLTVVVHPA